MVPFTKAELSIIGLRGKYLSKLLEFSCYIISSFNLWIYDMIIGHFSWLFMTYHHGLSLYKAIHRIQKEQIKGHKQYMRMNLVHNTIHVTVLKLLFPTEVESVTQSDIPNDMTSNQVKDTQHKCRVLCYWC